MNRDHTRQTKGQTLLELVVVLGVVALVLTGLTAAVTSSLRYGQTSRFRSRAVKLAQEGMELARKLRDSNSWDIFLSYSGTGTKAWCLSQDGTWGEDTGSGCPVSAGNTFWRSVTFTWNDPVMGVKSEVSWGKHSTPSVVTMNTQLTQWQ